MPDHRFHDPRRAAKATILVPLTPEEADLAVEALRHVGHEIFRNSPKGDRLYDASTAIAQALDSKR